jgi:hypothetical protein
MTTRRDIGPVLDRWLAEGPIQIADRVVFAALETVAQTEQPRVARGLRRNALMNRTWRLAVAAAVVVVIGGGAIVALGLRSSDSVGASPSPTAGPSAVTLVSPRMTAGVLYRIVPFSPPLTIIGRQDWFTIGDTTSAVAFFAKGPNEPDGPDDFSVSIIVPSQVLPAGAAASVPAPTDLVAWLRSRSDLALSAPGTAQIGGLPAKVIEGTVRPTAILNSDRNVILMCTAACGREAGGALAVTASYHFKIYVIDVRGTTVVIRADSPEATWASRHQEVDGFLSTLTFPTS